MGSEAHTQTDVTWGCVCWVWWEKLRKPREHRKGKAPGWGNPERLLGRSGIWGEPWRKVGFLMNTEKREVFIWEMFSLSRSPEIRGHRVFRDEREFELNCKSLSYRRSGRWEAGLERLNFEGYSVRLRSWEFLPIATGATEGLRTEEWQDSVFLLGLLKSTLVEVYYGDCEGWAEGRVETAQWGGLEKSSK